MNTKQTSPDTLLEFVLDKIRHPKYGEMTWEREKGVDLIRRRNRVIYTDSKEAVAKLWRELKQSMTAVTEADDYDDVDTMAQKSPRALEKPKGPDFEWLSGFDVKEIQQAIDEIVEYLPTVVNDQEQTTILRNDIRILDNLMSAIKSKKSDQIVQCWKICSSEGSCEHLHEEFVAKMNKAIQATSESFFESLGRPSRHRCVFQSKADWLAESIRRSYSMRDNGGFTDAFNGSGALVGCFGRNRGWVFESALFEEAPPGEEAWVNSNKDRFIKQYGQDKGLEILYATAWKQYNQKHGKSPAAPTAPSAKPATPAPEDEGQV